MGIDRSTIEEKFKWQIEKMYPNKEAIEKDIEKVKELTLKSKEYKGKLNEGWENLYGALNVSEEASRILQSLYVYTHMKQHEDTRINENQSIAT
ncbi:MAG: oligoendopeptidase F, partial [Romboutsia sp.]